MKRARKIRFYLGASAILGFIVLVVLMIIGMTCFGNTIFTAGVSEPLQKIPTTFLVAEFIALVITAIATIGYYFVDNSISNRLRRK